MKKNLRIFLLLGIAFAIGAVSLKAQQMPPIPVDNQVRIGKLENGLTYYIRQNKLPANRANFYIVQKVGSILEEESQRGLAHFLEHMAFNGSKNFPADETGPSIVSYLESIGVKFGSNLNAETGMDHTIYNINDVPTVNQGAIDSCLLILHDWAGSLLLREKEIDKERKVIHEEWRTGQTGQMRMLEESAPVIFKDSKYAERFPIGLMSVVDNFEPQVLRDYYHKWYRPDLQGIIVVGDIDPEQIEQQIQTLFSDRSKPVNPAERVYETIPDNDEPLISFVADKEIQATNILVFFKRDPIPASVKANLDYLIIEYAQQLIQQMLNNRFQEMLEQGNSPFLFAMVRNGDYYGVQAKDALQLIAVTQTEGIESTISSLFREAKRVRDFGFTDGEYERARADYLSGLEKLYNERDKQQNGFFVAQYVSHFLKSDPIPSIEDRYNMLSQILPAIPLEVINQLAQGITTEKNQVVIVMGNDPTATIPVETLQATIKAVDQEELTAYEDQATDEPLLSEIPQAGSILKESFDEKQGSYVWNLSNGARVIVKPTDFKDDEILFTAFAYGGSSMIDNQHISEAKFINDFAPLGGLGAFSASNLKKALAGKHIGVSTTLNSYSQAANGSSTIKDLESFMQLLYLNFTAVRADETAYNSFVDRMKNLLPHLANNPEMVMADSLMNAVYMGNPRMTIPTAEEIGQASYTKSLEIYRSYFANAADFTFMFAGSVNPEILKPLVEQYIASLPSKTDKPSKAFNAQALPVRKGAYINNFTRELEVPKASIQIIYSGKLPYTLADHIQLDALKQVLDMELIDKIREEKGGTYGVQVKHSAEKLPEESFTIELKFDTDPNRRVELTDAIEALIAAIQQHGPQAEKLQKVKEYMLKQHADNLKKNGYAIRNLHRYYNFGTDFETGYEKLVEGLTIDSLKAFAKKLFSQGNRIEVSMSSEE